MSEQFEATSTLTIEQVFISQQKERIAELEDLLISAHAIATRRGQVTAWERFAERLTKAGIGSVTARTFRVLESDTVTCDRCKCL